MYCNNCGAKLEDDYTFCPECGNSIIQNTNAQEDIPLTISYEKGRGVLILILGILSVFLMGPFTGIPAWVMGIKERKKINSGIISANQKEKTTIGMVLGIIGTSVFFIFLIFSIALKTDKSLPNATSRSNYNDKKNIYSDSTRSDSKSIATDKSSENRTSVEQQYNTIGTQINIGHFSYLVNNVKFAKTIGNEFSQTTADGIFLIVNMTFRNNDKEEHTLDNSFFKLTDETGTEYESSTEGETALEMSGQNTLFLKQCNPYIIKTGSLIFEVPVIKDYYLHLSGGFWSGETAIVKLSNKR